MISPLPIFPALLLLHYTNNCTFCDRFPAEIIFSAIAATGRAGKRLRGGEVFEHPQKMEEGSR